MFETKFDKTKTSSKSQPGKPEFKLQGPMAYRDNFVRYPEPVYDKVMVSKLPVQAKEIIEVVARFTFGYGMNSCIFQWTYLRSYVTGDKSKVNRTIKWLIQQNVLKGGPIKSKYNNNIGSWDLSINPNVMEWDIGRDNEKQDSFREMQKMAGALKSQKHQNTQNQIKKNSAVEQAGCEYSPEPGDNLAQDSKSWDSN
jgi:hypothetical protein